MKKKLGTYEVMSIIKRESNRSMRVGINIIIWESFKWQWYEKGAREWKKYLN